MCQRRLKFEALESRRCLSAAGLQVLARTGDNFSEIRDFVSINDFDQVSFVARSNTGAPGVYVGKHPTEVPQLVTFNAGQDRSYGRASSIAIQNPAVNSFQVAAVDTWLGLSQVRLWNNGVFDAPVAASYEPQGTEESEEFDAFTSMLDVNDKGEVAFVGIDTTGVTSHKLRVRTEGTQFGQTGNQRFLGFNSVEIGDFPATAGLRPQISDNTEVIFRSVSGSSILKTDPRSAQFRRIAGAQEGFVAQGDIPAVGRSPGINDDGRIVAFFGNHQEDGPGIYISIQEPDGSPSSGSSHRRLLRIAGNAGELGLDPADNPIRLTEFSTQSSISNATTTDSRVGIAGDLSFEFHSASRIFVTFLANDPTRGGREALWRVTVNANLLGPPLQDAGQLQIVVGKPEQILTVGEKLFDYTVSPTAAIGMVTDLEIYDPVSDNGSIAFWVQLDNSKTAVVRAPATRRPVLLVPGIVGTFPDSNNFDFWLNHRGVPPDLLQLDPLAHFYDDIVQTLKNAGYVEGKDLFVVKYDWRMPPAPIPYVNTMSEIGIFDGRIDGVRQRINLTDNSRFHFGVDYLITYLRDAAEAWQKEFPGQPLESVDIIAHSTGGLVSRGYIQSDAYGQSFQSSKLGAVPLPKVNNFVMAGVPNRGAAKAWNPLHNNFIDDLSFRHLLSKVIYLAFKKQPIQSHVTGETIENEVVYSRFIDRYVPTIRGLLATYPFLKRLDSSQYATVNDKTSERNNLLLDLNFGLDGPELISFEDSIGFVDDVGFVLNLFGTDSGATPIYVDEYQGPNSISNAKDPIVGMQDYMDREPVYKEPWFHTIEVKDSGDGTVPLESARDMFVGSPRTNLQSLGFQHNEVPGGSVGHTDLLSNVSIQSRILAQLGQAVSSSKISTGQARKSWLIGETVWSTYINDPVEGFLVDGMGRRLGYSAATGVLNEIPGSLYFGNEDGIGFIQGDVATPLRMQLTGLGSDYYAEVSGIAGGTNFGMNASGFLGAGETFVATALQSYNRAPVAENDSFEAPANLVSVFDVLTNDRDPEGGALLLVVVDTAASHGTARISGNKIEYTPRSGFEGLDQVRYTIRDSEGAQSTAKIEIVVPGRPKIISVTPDAIAAVTMLNEISIEFSVAMQVPAASDKRNYQLVHETLGIVPIAAVVYSDSEGRHRARLRLSSTPMVPGKVQVQVNTSALKSHSGLAVGGTAEKVLLIETNGNVQQLDQFENAPQAQAIVSPPGFDAPTHFAMEDLNGDGLLDVVSPSPSSSQLVVRFGAVNQRFEDPLTVTLPAPVPNLPARPLQVVIADWNRDSHPDILVYDYATSYWEGDHRRLHIYLNSGAGTFRPADDTPIYVGGEILAVGDFVGDSSPDVAIAEGDVAIYSKDRFLGYTRAAQLPLGVDGWYASSLTTADLNEDGRVDLVVSATGYYLSNPGTVVFLSTASGYAPGTQLSLESFGGHSVAIGDFNGDGHSDLAILHDLFRRSYGVLDGAAIAFLKGDGRGNFVLQENQLLGRRFVNLVGTDDSNGDGKLDLVLTANPYDPAGDLNFPALIDFSTWALPGDGQGKFSTAQPPKTLIPGGNVPDSLISLDLDQDGKLDLVTTNSQLASIDFFRGSENGTFLKLDTKLTTNPRLDTIAPDAKAYVDVNGDGNLDLVAIIGTQYQLAVSIMLGNVDGLFTLDSILPISGTLSSWGGQGWLRTADLNGDKNLDIVVGLSTAVNVLLGDGSGRFAKSPRSPVEPTELGAIDSHNPGLIADVNKDGNLDLVLVNSQSSSAYEMASVGWMIMFGDGSGDLFFNKNTFHPFPPNHGVLPPPAYTTNLRYPPSLHDVNGDGFLDLISGDGPGRVIVYRGNGTGRFGSPLESSFTSGKSLLSFRFADFNGDNKVDALGYGSSEVTLLLGNGGGLFSEATQSSSDADAFIAGRSISGIFIGQLDGNSRADLILSLKGSTEAGVFLNDGLGKLVANEPINAESNLQDIQSLGIAKWSVASIAQLSAELWPPRLSSNQLRYDVQRLTGIGPINSTVHVLNTQLLEIGVAFTDQLGQWTLDLGAPLAVGTHSLRLFATDASSASSQFSEELVNVTPPSNPWHNSAHPFDVNRDLSVTPIDVLLVINYLNTVGSGQLPSSRPLDKGFLDTNGDGVASPLDVLIVINFLNSKSLGEGEATGRQVSFQTNLSYLFASPKNHDPIAIDLEETIDWLALDAFYLILKRFRGW